MTRAAAWMAALGAGEPDQAGRLARFRASHPDVIIGGAGFGTWQALAPQPHGEQVFTRYSLRELLDKLYEVFPPGTRGT